VSSKSRRPIANRAPVGRDPTPFGVAFQVAAAAVLRHKPTVTKVERCPSTTFF